MNLSEFNQNVAMLALALWPGLLALRGLDVPRRPMLMGLFFLVLAIPIAISEHDSSQLGLAASLLVLPLTWLQPHTVIRALAIAWCLGFVLVLPLDFLAFKAGLHEADWLPKSARARIIIWEFTAEQVLEKPWLGIGAEFHPDGEGREDDTAGEARGLCDPPHHWAACAQSLPADLVQARRDRRDPGGDRRRGHRVANPAFAGAYKSKPDAMKAMKGMSECKA